MRGWDISIFLFHAKTLRRKENMTEKELSKIIVNSCFKIHNTLGPGLLESVYEEILAYELERKEGLF